MGFGDVKFYAPAAIILGPVGVIYGFFVAVLIAAVVGSIGLVIKQERQFPFGPYLAVAVPVTWWLGPLIHQRLFVWP